MPSSQPSPHPSSQPFARQILQSQGLFGESRQLPDVVHCETIAARSALHDWELAPHRHGRLHQVLMLQSGAGQAQIEGQSLPLGPGSLINVAPGDVHAFRFEPDTQGHVVTLADEMMELLLAEAGEVRLVLGRSFVGLDDGPVAALMPQIWAEFNGLRAARALVLRGLCATLLGLVARAAARAVPSPGEAARPVLLTRFEALLERHFREHWGVADYARALSVTPTHLSRVVRAATGEPASALIEARLMREARRNLAYTHLHVATIAYGLGFADPAHFSRVFTRAAGVSPRAFRRGLAAPA
ncbi:helix-turn-helix domain-containing protein [Castellaniella defragrans]|uniref:AraC family transcriptional activator of pobA n=1 Tax=Castellaniella defragrans TaxID=75697 RepID=A0A7W9TN54_CASDE|nr:helix-turn-helix domain-containing protein [Castellaniella defragrans]KAB0601604.1 helix-turn-helix domain-containing protein [Castellaniella defragrans]MBB6082933.1 AraC family transcriptional activator of pobA [Castellaniella defragrans]